MTMSKNKNGIVVTFSNFIKKSCDPVVLICKRFTSGSWNMYPIFKPSFGMRVTTYFIPRFHFPASKIQFFYSIVFPRIFKTAIAGEAYTTRKWTSINFVGRNKL